MIVLAIDPASGRSRSASKTGWALFHVWGKTERLLEYGALTAVRVDAAEERARLLSRADVLVIEAQHQGPNPATLMSLVEARSKWTVVATDQYRLPVHLVRPVEWISRLQRGWRVGRRKDLGKIFGYLRMRWQLTEGMTISDDALTAIAIGTAWIDKRKITQRRRL